MPNVLKILIIQFFLFCAPLSAQNILVNPSFEQYTSSAWRGILTVDMCDAGPTQEGYIVPAHGSICAGLRFFSPIEDDWQEYLCQSVYYQLDSGTVWRISFKYRLSDRCIYSTDDLGVGFLHGSYGYQDLTSELMQTLQVAVKGPENIPLTNYNSWQEFSQFYTATGTEMFFVLGSFKTDANLTYLPINNSTSNPMPDIYFFIDDVKLEACPPMPSSLLDERVLFCDSLPGLVSTNNLADSYLWSNGSTNDSTYATNSDQTLWLEATFGTCKMRDTIKIERFSESTDLGPDFLICSEKNLPVMVQTQVAQNETVLWSNGTNNTNLLIEQPGNYSVIKSREQCEWKDTIRAIDLSAEMLMFPNPTYNEVFFNHPEDMVIHGVFSEEGKNLSSGVISSAELNQILLQLQPAIYYVDIELEGCRKVVSLSLIRD